MTRQYPKGQDPGRAAGQPRSNRLAAEPVGDGVVVVLQLHLRMYFTFGASPV